MRTLLLLLLAGIAADEAATQAVPDDPAGAEFFEKKIRPILIDRCHSCHSATAAKLKGGLRLDSLETALKGGDSGPALIPGKPETSRIVEAVTYKNVDLRMPPKGKLPAEQIADFAEWVKRGAPWPKGDPAAGAAKKAEFNLAQRKAEHWAWQPLRADVPPAVKNAAWPKRPLDRFLLAKLEERGLEPAPPADPRTLVRRLAFDLSGLPPTPGQVDAFVADPSDAALERLVDALLSSPRFAETWARHWLDLTRYAESRGHEYDYLLPNAWHYRDYVIRAFDQDLPYPQFVTEHIAGDLLPEARVDPRSGIDESVLATGWWYLGEWLHSPVDTRTEEMDRVSNQIEVFGKTFLGLTVSCARCHDHKFDAISQKDFYALAGFLKSSNYRQVRFDTIDKERRAARDLERLRDERERTVLQAVAVAARPVLSRLADYLEAAAAPEKGAAGRQLDPERLAAWIAQLRKSAGDPKDPLHAYAVAAQGGNLAALATKDRARQTNADKALENADILFDFTKPEPADWTQDGVTFRRMNTGDAGWGTDPRQPLLEILATGALRADPLWQSLRLAPKTQTESSHRSWVDSGRMARTATFALRRTSLYSLVRGAGHAFIEVDSHRQINGPLHASTVASWKEEGRRWIAQNLRHYPSPDPDHPLHRLHVEYTPASPDFEVLMVVQADAPPGDPFDRPHRPILEAIEAGPSPRALAETYQKLMADAADRLAAGKLGAEPEAAQLADWMVRRPELFGAVAPEAADYAAARAKIAASVPAESRTAPAILAGPAADEYLLIRGNGAAPKEVVPRRFLEAFGGGGHSGRLELARQMTDPHVTPLVPRVAVNRIWHHLFGRGLVPTVDDFGRMGLQTVHPELLDHLATRFGELGGSFKKMIREIVLSSAYRMSDAPSAKALEADAANTLLQHRSPRRISAEAVRDAMLAVSGRLDPLMYGPPVPIHLDGFQDGRGRPADGPVDGAGRRSLYLAVHRNFLSSMLLAFDFPQPFSAIGRRSVSNVPAQALILRNNPFVHNQALVWARRLLAEGKPAAERIDGMFREAFGRPAAPDEIAGALQLLKDVAAMNAQDPGSVDVWKELCHALFQAKEFIFVK
jgi:cytochrome c553